MRWESNYAFDLYRALHFFVGVGCSCRRGYYSCMLRKCAIGLFTTSRSQEKETKVEWNRIELAQNLWECVCSFFILILGPNWLIKRQTKLIDQVLMIDFLIPNEKTFAKSAILLVICLKETLLGRVFLRGREFGWIDFGFAEKRLLKIVGPGRVLQSHQNHGKTWVFLVGRVRPLYTRRRILHFLLRM